MAVMIRWGVRFIQRPATLPRQLVKGSQIRKIHSSHLIEEEKLRHYQAEQFYPVRIGEIFNSQYQVLGKLGYGAYSTVWLCRDLSYVVLPPFPSSFQLMQDSHHRYVAVKVYIRQKSEVNRELKIYEHLTKLGSPHPGQAYIRGVYDAFEINAPGGGHVCLVHPLLHMTVSDWEGPSWRHSARDLQSSGSAVRDGMEP
jgi:serine/threonine protein kinase